MVAGAMCLFFVAEGLQAETIPTRPTAPQMQAIQDCAAAQGVALPAPTPGRPNDGGPGLGNPSSSDNRPPIGPPPMGNSAKERTPGPQLTDAQRAIIDACFTAQGLTPLKKAEHKDGLPPK